MKKMYDYASASKALEELEKDGFTIDYNVEEKQILENPDDFEIHKIFRYEGMSNPDDESSVYGIARKTGTAKGFFVAGNLSFADNETAKILLSMEIDERKKEG